LSKPTTRTWVNGQACSTISLLERAFQYGDGFFTTMLVCQGKIYNWSGHWFRIEQSALRLGFPKLDQAQTLEQLAGVLSEQDLPQPQVLKLIVSRGQGGVGYQPPSDPSINLVVQLSPHPVYATSEEMAKQPEPLQLKRCDSVCGINPQLAGLKHLNRLENVLARAELADTGFAEGLMLNANQQVICATQSNLFLIQGKEVITPDLSQSGVAGTTRHTLPQIIKNLGLTWCERIVRLEDLAQADEVFLSNALRGIMPVAKFEEQVFAVERTFEIQQAWYEWQQNNAKQVV